MKLEDLYKKFDEEKRLFRNKASRVEWITTNHFLSRYVETGDTLIDAGAGSGAYAFHYAKQGVNVHAMDLLEKHVRQMQKKQIPGVKVEQADARDLSHVKDETADVTLLLGPLYHLKEDDEKKQAIAEAFRITKRGGVIFMAHISPRAVFVTESFLYNAEFLGSDLYDSKSFYPKELAFTFLSVDDMRNLMRGVEHERLHHFAADGLSELLTDKLDNLSEEQFDAWVAYHLHTCEEERLLDYSHHLVYVARKL